jgi:CubicO group peptidase (beta-lactamase class C family)
MNANSSNMLRQIVILVAALTMSGCTSSNQSSTEASFPAQLETEIRTLMEDWEIPGMSVCVIKDGDIVWHRGLGIKNVQTGDPVNEETVFQAASTSKPVFAYAVLRMHDEGLLDLDTPLLEYAPIEFVEKAFLGHSIDMPGFKKEWFSKITARMALSHSSGLQHFGLKKPVELRFEPGTEFYYSSNGIEYLRHIVEHLTGTRIDELISEYVLEPLDMKCSSFSWRDQYESNSAPGHDQFGETSGRMDRYASPTAQASLYTNARDYGKFLLAVLQGEGLREETYNEMVKPQIRTNHDVYWGLGFGLEMASGGKGIWHWGDGGTHTCYFYGNLEHKSGFVYFANSYYGLAILDDIFELVSEGEHPALSLTLGEWSFHDDYLSPSMAFQNKLFNGRPENSLAFYHHIASTHEKGNRFIDESRMQYWTKDLLRNGRVSDAIALSQLLLDAYHPERSDTCASLAREYQEFKTADAAVRYLEAATDIINDTKFAWAVDGAISGLRPVALDVETLRSFTGRYDPHEITYDNGTLFFDAAEAGRFELVPVKEDTFALKEVDYFRIQILKENGAVVAAKGIWSDGQSQVYQKGN